VRDRPAEEGLASGLSAEREEAGGSSTYADRGRRPAWPRCDRRPLRADHRRSAAARAAARARGEPAGAATRNIDKSRSGSDTSHGGVMKSGRPRPNRTGGPRLVEMGMDVHRSTGSPGRTRRGGAGASGQSAPRAARWCPRGAADHRPYKLASRTSAGGLRSRCRDVRIGDEVHRDGGAVLGGERAQVHAAAAAVRRAGPRSSAAARSSRRSSPYRLPGLGEEGCCACSATRRTPKTSSS